MSRALRRYSTRIQHSMGDVTKLTEQSLHGHRVVKVFEGQEHERRQFKDVNTRNFRLQRASRRRASFGDALTQYAVALGVAAVMYFSFSDLECSVVPRLRHGDGHVARAAEAPHQHQRRRAARHCGRRRACSRFSINRASRIRERRPLARARGDVAYRGVSFRYDAGKDPALRDMSLDVPAGTTVALVGQSGSGKSTLVSLLPRFYDPEQGAVLLDGQRRAQLHAARPATADRAREPGHRAVRRHDRQQHRLRRARRRTRAPTSSARRKRRTSWSSPRRCRKGSTRASANAARCSRAASGSASRSRVRC